ncbi:MAG: type II secretion system minor pseudopilin GspK [Sulfuritalea sp.]|jgi:general secretion pathway protein K|nr:type II secretion system minor pseudopilin GspK [Sulfuritalea sp.]
MIRSRGSAIVAALLIVALVALIGGRVLMVQGMSINQFQARDDYDMARETASAGLHWARAILYDDSRRSSIDHLGEPWAQPMPPTVVGETTVSGYIEDAQGRFNLNSLAINGKMDPTALSVFARLLSNLGLAPELAETATDWIDEDDELISQNSAESSYYMTQQPRYRPSGLPYGSAEELLRVRGFSPSILEKLRPFVIALPIPAPVNVNTASPELLSALVPALPLGNASRIADERQRSPFNSAAEFLDRVPGARGDKIPPLGVQSQFFLVSGSARQSNTYYQVVALLQRQESRWPRIVWQMPQ